MKIQFACDTFTPKEAIQAVESVRKYISIVEIGTPMLLRYGVEPVREMKEHFPELEILADEKIADGGCFESEFAFEAGADIVTVLGYSNTNTILNVIQTSKKHNKKCLVDMMCLEPLEDKAKEFIEAGADYICIHNATDALDIDRTLKLADRLKGIVPSENLVIAGGINLENIAKVKKYNPEIMIIGSAISKSENMEKTAQALYEEMQK